MCCFELRTHAAAICSSSHSSRSRSLPEKTFRLAGSRCCSPRLWVRRRFSCNCLGGLRALDACGSWFSMPRTTSLWAFSGRYVLSSASPFPCWALHCAVRVVASSHIHLKRLQKSRRLQKMHLKRGTGAGREGPPSQRLPALLGSWTAGPARKYRVLLCLLPCFALRPFRCSGFGRLPRNGYLFVSQLFAGCVLGRHGPTGRPDRQTDRQTSRQTDKQTDRQADRQTSRQTDRQTDRQKKLDKDSKAHRQTGRQPHRQTDTQGKHKRATENEDRKGPENARTGNDRKTDRKRTGSQSPERTGIAFRTRARKTGTGPEEAKQQDRKRTGTIVFSIDRPGARPCRRSAPKPFRTVPFSQKPSLLGESAWLV